MARSPVVLCVDDRPNLLAGRQRLLEEDGYTVLTARNGREAVEVFISNPVDLVLLDYCMPEANGDVVARRMKAHKPDVPIAALSGDDSLPSTTPESADVFISESEPIVSLLEQVDHLVSLRLLFQPLEVLETED
jgi:two-component system, OmpR family, response regulator VanR